MKTIGICLVLILLMSSYTSSVTYNVGLKVGDEFQYNTVITGTTYSSLQIQILNITETVITFFERISSTNGSSYDQPIVTDNITTGILVLFISANLEENDTIFPADPVLYVINQTVSENVLGTNRTVNILSLKNEVVGSMNITWDQLTGALISWQQLTSQNKTQTIVSMRLSSTNAWSPNITSANITDLPPYFVYAILNLPFIVVAVISGVVVAICVRHQKNKEKERKKQTWRNLWLFFVV
jgi:hypothetical protein